MTHIRQHPWQTLTVIVLAIASSWLNIPPTDGRPFWLVMLTAVATGVIIGFAVGFGAAALRDLRAWWVSR